MRAIEWARRQPRAAARAAITEREARREAAWDRSADDVLDDAVPAFHGQPFAAVPAG